MVWFEEALISLGVPIVEDTGAVIESVVFVGMDGPAMLSRFCRIQRYRRPSLLLSDAIDSKKSCEDRVEHVNFGNCG